MDTVTEIPIEEIQEATGIQNDQEQTLKSKEKAIEEEIKRAALKLVRYEETDLGILGDRNITGALMTGKVTEAQAEQLRAEDEEIQFNRRMYSQQQEAQILKHYGLDPEIAKGLGWYFSTDFHRLQNQLPEDQRMSLEERKARELHLEDLYAKNVLLGEPSQGVEHQKQNTQDAINNVRSMLGVEQPQTAQVAQPQREPLAPAIQNMSAGVSATVSVTAPVGR